MGVVFLGAMVTPVIGVASTITIMVAVQLLTSIVIDTLGLFGVAKVPLDTGRIIGAVILVIAARLIVK